MSGDSSVVERGARNRENQHSNSSLGLENELLTSILAPISLSLRKSVVCIWHALVLEPRGIASSEAMGGVDIVKADHAQVADPNLL